MEDLWYFKKHSCFILESSFSEVAWERAICSGLAGLGSPGTFLPPFLDLANWSMLTELQDFSILLSESWQFSGTLKDTSWMPWSNLFLKGKIIQESIFTFFAFSRCRISSSASPWLMSQGSSYTYAYFRLSSSFNGFNFTECEHCFSTEFSGIIWMSMCLLGSAVIAQGEQVSNSCMVILKGFTSLKEVIRLLMKDVLMTVPCYSLFSYFSNFFLMLMKIFLSLTSALISSRFFLEVLFFPPWLPSLALLQQLSIILMILELVSRGIECPIIFMKSTEFWSLSSRERQLLCSRLSPPNFSAIFTFKLSLRQFRPGNCSEISLDKFNSTSPLSFLLCFFAAFPALPLFSTLVASTDL